MNYSKIIKKLIDKANLEISQDCGLRPFKIPYRLTDIFEDEEYLKEVLKAVCGFAVSIDTSLEQIDGTRLMLPAWDYHFKILKQIKDFEGVEFAFIYLEKLI